MDSDGVKFAQGIAQFIHSVFDAVWYSPPRCPNVRLLVLPAERLAFFMQKKDRGRSRPSVGESTGAEINALRLGAD